MHLVLYPSLSLPTDSHEAVFYRKPEAAGFLAICCFHIDFQREKSPGRCGNVFLQLLFQGDFFRSFNGNPFETGDTLIAFCQHYGAQDVAEVVLCAVFQGKLLLLLVTTQSELVFLPVKKNSSIWVPEALRTA